MICFNHAKIFWHMSRSLSLLRASMYKVQNWSHQVRFTCHRHTVRRLNVLESMDISVISSVFVCKIHQLFLTSSYSLRCVTLLIISRPLDIEIFLNIVHALILYRRISVTLPPQMNHHRSIHDTRSKFTNNINLIKDGFQLSIIFDSFPRRKEWMSSVRWGINHGTKLLLFHRRILYYIATNSLENISVGKDDWTSRNK